MHELRRHLDLVLVAFGAAPRDLAADGADLALEIADAGFTRVAADHRAQALVGERHLRLGEAVVLHLLGDQVIARDRELLFLGVAGELEHFHAIAQRRRNRVEHVRRRDEQHFAQVERHVEIVIAERVVLFRIEHFEQRRRRIAAEVGAELVDLVEDEHRVLRLGAAQALDDLPGQRADVGAAMAADLRLVAHAAERDAHELAAERLRDRARERGLADARRADEAQDRPLHRRD